MPGGYACQRPWVKNDKCIPTSSTERLAGWLIGWWFGWLHDCVGRVLMEGTPNFLEYTEILNVFKRIEGVERVHNLRIWALSINRVALSVHLAVALDSEVYSFQLFV
uniref:Cation efflux protein cytoplasmic domain-containing protein n=1 Tax=Glossina austeni TaxID=7395 RepID=A0A1A9UH34_GLOAU